MKNLDVAHDLLYKYTNDLLTEKQGIVLENLICNGLSQGYSEYDIFLPIYNRKYDTHDWDSDTTWTLKTGAAHSNKFAEQTKQD